jgi:hypothetical protein
MVGRVFEGRMAYFSLFKGQRKRPLFNSKIYFLVFLLSYTKKMEDNCYQLIFFLTRWEVNRGTILTEDPVLWTISFTTGKFLNNGLSMYTHNPCGTETPLGLCIEKYNRKHHLAPQISFLSSKTLGKLRLKTSLGWGYSSFGRTPA